MKLIAETAFHHDGDFEFASNLIDNIVQSSADVIKIHILLDLDKYMDNTHSAYEFLKERTFTKAQWSILLDKIKQSSKELMVLLNDVDAVELVADFDPALIEVHSVALNNSKLLKKMNDTFSNDTKVVLGVGGSTLYEIENAASQFLNKDIILMFGFQNYPTKYEDVNFKKMRRIMNAFPEYEYGYADHTAWDLKENVLITLMGAAQGVSYVEKHVTTHYGEQRTDYSAAVTFEMLDEIKKGLEILEKCNGNGQLALNYGEKSYCVPGAMKQVAKLNQDVDVGEVFQLDMVNFLRSGAKNGMAQIDIWEAQGKPLTKSVKAGEILTYAHFEE